MQGRRHHSPQARHWGQLWTCHHQAQQPRCGHNAHTRLQSLTGERTQNVSSWCRGRSGEPCQCSGISNTPFTISPPHEDSELGWDGFISAADPTSGALCVGRTHRGPVLSGTASIRLSGIKGNTGKGLVFQGKSPHKGKPAESLLEQWGTACPGPPPQTGGEDVHQCAPVIRTPGT